jgi:hypothetical protein
MFSPFGALALTFWVGPAFAPALSLFADPSGPGFVLQVGLSAVAGTLLAARTDHEGGTVLAFALTTVAVSIVAGLALGYPVNEPPTPLAVAVPFWRLGLSVGYTVWLGGRIDRIRERLDVRSEG